MTTKTRASSGGIGCGTILLIIFVVLKLTDQIDWSWWWVLAPLWLPVAIWLAVLLITSVLVAVAALFKR